MGQKVNPNIFRLGVNKKWKTTFFEKNNNELADYVFKDLETIKFIERFFNIQGMYCHDYQIQYNKSRINILVSYFVPVESMFNINNSPRYHTLLLDTKSNKNLFNSKNPDFFKPNKTLSFKREFNHYSNTLSGFKSLLKSNSNKSSVVQMRDFKSLQSLNSGSDLLEMNIKIFLNSLSEFLQNNFHITFTLNCVNNDFNLTQKQVIMFKKKFMFLQKFKNLNYFTKIINICFIALTTNKSANLLAFCIAHELKTVKRQKPFLNLLKRFFSLFLNTNFSKLDGVKITLKGRLNGAPRARHKTIVIGNVPAQKLDAKIDYAQTAADNLNGSYGVKVWLKRR